MPGALEFALLFLAPLATFLTHPRPINVNGLPVARGSGGQIVRAAEGDIVARLVRKDTIFRMVNPTQLIGGHRHFQLNNAIPDEPSQR
ncbi:hypothetical protein D3C84_1001280 [compost metagenome]